MRLRAEPARRFIEGKAHQQLGSLGGGHHFIEAQRDEVGGIWFMVH